MTDSRPDILRDLAFINRLDRDKQGLTSTMVARHILVRAEEEIERLRMVEAAISDMHRTLWPERYWTQDEMDNEGYRTEWSLDTANAVAHQVEQAVEAAEIAGLQTDPNYRPPTEEELLKGELRAMRNGDTIPISEREMLQRDDDPDIWLVIDTELGGVDERLDIDEAAEVVRFARGRE